MFGYRAWIFIFFLFLIGFTACVGTNCGNTVCTNGGLCVDGRCNCPTGYEGPHCETAWNEKFIGTWQVTDTLVDTTATFLSTYKIHVYSNGTGGGFYIDHLGGYSDSVKAKADSLNGIVSGPKTFNFIAAYSKDSSFYLTSGTGTLYSAGRVSASMRYTVKSKTYSLYTGWVKQ